jgi:hypothetical protein
MPKFATTALLKLKGATTEEASIAAVAASNVDKAVILRMARTVGTETMVSALAESVKPRMGGKDLSSLESLEKILTAGLQTTGGAKTDTVFSFDSHGNKLIVGINGKKVGEVSSSVLSNAFVNVYVDKDTVSTGLRDSSAKTLLSWLK